MVNLTVQAPKEVVDVLKAVDDLVAKIMAKEPLSQLVVEELAQAVKLAGEVLAVPGDVKQDPGDCLDAGALFGRRIVSRLLGKAVSPVSVS